MPAIRSLPFRHNQNPALGFEIFRLSSLLQRFERRQIDHAIDAPQRPEFHTIYIGIRGQGHLFVDFQKVPIGAHTLTFVARGRVQQFAVDRAGAGSAAGRGRAPSGEGGVDAWMLMFAPEFLMAGAAPDPLALPATLSPSWMPPALAVPAAEHRALLALADQLDAEHARADALQPWLLAALLRVVLLRAERLIDRGPPLPAALQRFFTILEADHARTRSVAHYARRAGISPRRLAELLHAHTGKPTKQVIDERVILEHKRLLVHTELSVKELAARTGFAEPTNLVKFFRHHTQQTPLEFRARHVRGSSPSRRRS